MDRTAFLKTKDSLVDIGANLTHDKLAKDVDSIIEKARDAGKWLGLPPVAVIIVVAFRTGANHGHRGKQGEH